MFTRVPPLAGVVVVVVVAVVADDIIAAGVIVRPEDEVDGKTAIEPARPSLAIVLLVGEADCECTSCQGRPVFTNTYTCAKQVDQRHDNNNDS